MIFAIEVHECPESKAVGDSVFMDFKDNWGIYNQSKGQMLQFNIHECPYCKKHLKRRLRCKVNANNFNGEVFPIAEWKKIEGRWICPNCLDHVLNRNQERNLTTPRLDCKNLSYVDGHIVQCNCYNGPKHV